MGDFLKKKPQYSYTIRLLRDSKAYWPGFFALLVLAGISALLQTRVSLLWGELVDGGIMGDKTTVASSFLYLAV